MPNHPNRILFENQILQTQPVTGMTLKPVRHLGGNSEAQEMNLQVVAQLAS